jgi:hypothetical protein
MKYNTLNKLLKLDNYAGTYFTPDMGMRLVIDRQMKWELHSELRMRLHREILWNLKWQLWNNVGRTL